MTKTFIHIDPKLNKFGLLHENMHKERPPRVFREMLQHLGKNRESVILEVTSVRVLSEDEVTNFINHGEAFDASKHLKGIEDTPND